METVKKQERRQRIEAAAYEILFEQGYKAASMLAIAKQAGCSNETMYRWYGDKSGLYGSLIKSLIFRWLGNIRVVSRVL